MAILSSRGRDGGGVMMSVCMRRVCCGGVGGMKLDVISRLAAEAEEKEDD